ncbi:glucose/arabinose dehydrogenase [Streptomyces sp. PvR006]|uniref:PQQ-dependent sugar dehydrogenase n=1 Tax=Streptomyces sp. PvR006 TaxID=2817860 RepID=UPI001AE17F13|nr:PQQ-dependent sugar dehydrogenase [Streptomyces sp. PvR006]MBP2580450.1 glucose/arabinose dehydrogenase [Streptomyces sp. PvR006]
MNVRTRSSALLCTLGLVTTLALATASAEDAGTRQPVAKSANAAEIAKVAKAANGEEIAKAAKITLTPVATARNPIAGAAGPGGAIWIAERAGTVRVLGPKGLGEPVLDISAETTTDGERGLLGIAFDPARTHLYLSYTNLEGTSTIDEFAVRKGRIRPETRRTVLTQTQPYANHNGGDIRFGPDGYLYIAFGDGGAGGDPHGNGQNLDTLLGKMLRIDPRGGTPYAIPSDNPFVGDPNARDEIWAYGLRNPWRFSFDARTGDLFIGDVGQNDWEEIDRAPARSRGGENYGWSQMEGNHPFRGGTEPANHVRPIHEYPRTGLGCAVTGGFVYRGSAIPTLRGQYVFSDYCDGTIRSLGLRNGKVTGVNDLVVNGGEVISFVEGRAGELYVLALGGAITRIDPA